jgi:type I restriction enzyme M protein
VLFFTKGTPTKKIWYYQLDPGRNMGKTNPLSDADLEEFIRFSKTSADSGQSWSLDTSTADEGLLNLSVKNPNKIGEVDSRTPSEILDEIERLDRESAGIFAQLRSLL